MEKSIVTSEHRIFTETLRAARRKAGFTQVELAERIGESQPFVSRAERGESRVDIVQLRTICAALGTTLPAFVHAYEKRLAKPAKR